MKQMCAKQNIGRIFRTGRDGLTVAPKLFFMFHKQVDEGVALLSPQNVAVTPQVGDGDLYPACRRKTLHCSVWSP
jgi:hypothetical protein